MENHKNLVEEMEHTLNSIPGVLYIKIITTENDQNGLIDIEEINVVSNLERNPKQISRDIQSIFMAKFNLDIDHKKISIAQIFHDSKTSSNTNDKRLSIAGIDYSVNGKEIKTEVRLQLEDKYYRATEIGPNTVSNNYRVIANATIGAIHQFLDHQHLFALEDIKKIEVGKKEVIVVSVSVVTSEYEDLLIGNAVIKGDLRESIARAILDALNRRLSKIC
ncbi:hypothetical protein [Alkaliphilus hydrothermalis]|uniref:Uncharacterized protein n=1 Tax=Alkaliphilus hydrothermalis TaxID=1482730 RepID=A0ABS2NR31_9FIRM|nr:hypothetical protein [Alkaliphilus hydrothermalis]MBM7615385.1 hypothetical protein [Alkaliphilus hydrothermalis]